MIHYSRPLLDEYEGDFTFEEFKAVFEFAAFLWNLAAPEDIALAVQHLGNEMPPRLRLEAPRALILVRRMLARRSVEFAGDARLALEVNVHRRGGRTRVKALGVRFEPGPSRAGPRSEQAVEPEPQAHRTLH